VLGKDLQPKCQLLGKASACGNSWAAVNWNHAHLRLYFWNS
jgi:hypothetical protein